MTTKEYREQPDMRKACEDAQAIGIESLDEFSQATVYLLLYAQGMRIDKAREIRLKAGATN